MNIEKLKQEAEKGSVTAQAVLGICYLDGINTDENHREAFRWLSAAANQGSPRAMANLGFMYREGLGTEQSLPKAIELLERAAKAGEFMANIMLARLYREQDKSADAVFWYREALEYQGRIIAADEIREALDYTAQHGEPPA